MKYAFVLVALAMMVPTAFAGVPIEDFGLNGKRAPVFMGEPLPDAFFSASQAKALAIGANYTALVELKRAQIEATVVSGKIRDRSVVSSKPFILDQLQMTLVLANLADRDSDILVSAADENRKQIRNFVVRVETGSDISLDLSSLAGFQNLYLISTASFQASLEGYQNGLLVDARELRVNTPAIPVVDAKTVDYCVGGFYVYKQIVNDADSSYVYAYFYRTGPYTVGGYTHYGVEVHYPTIGTVFHNEGGTSHYTSHPDCKMLSQTTWQVSTSKNLKWSNKDSYWDGVDEVWFGSANGKAECVGNCDGDFTTFTIQ